MIQISLSYVGPALIGLKIRILNFMLSLKNSKVFELF